MYYGCSVIKVNVNWRIVVVAISGFIIRATFNGNCASNNVQRALLWFDAPDHHYRDISCFDCSLENTISLSTSPLHHPSGFPPLLACAQMRFVVYKID